MVSRLRNIVSPKDLLLSSGARFGKVQQIFQSVKNFETPERLKGTILERWAKYWRNLFIDYKDVAIDVCKEFKERPIKCSIYSSLLVSGFYCMKHNPDERCFRDDFLQKSQKMIYVGEGNRNPRTVEHLELVEDSYLQGIVRRMDLGIMSLIWLDNYDRKCALYKTTCSHLKPRYVTFYERIIDVGFLDTWWVLEDKMKDYDVNDEEFKQLET